MAAKPPHVLLVDCPPSMHVSGGGRQRRAWRNNPACRRACLVITLVLAAAGVITGVAMFLDCQFPSKDPVYTVVITGVTGLDDVVPPPPSPPPADDDDYITSSPPPPPLSPVFNLTFQIDNTRNAYYKACIPGLARADVSYSDAFLAGGSVPPFCAGERRTSDTVATRAWGENVAVPQFLRDQLGAELYAGDAEVNVKVTMQSTFCRSRECGGAVLSCKAKIDGTSSPCRVDFV